MGYETNGEPCINPKTDTRVSWPTKYVGDRGPGQPRVTALAIDPRLTVFSSLRIPNISALDFAFIILA